MAGFNSIDGIFSGLSTTDIVDAIMEYERQPAVLMEVNQAEKTNIVTTLKALQAKVFAMQSQIQKLTYKATYDKASVAVSDDSYLTASASGRVASGSYDLQIMSVAHNHQIASQGFSSEDITSMGTGTIEIGVGSASPQTITIDANNNSLNEIKDAINDAKVGVSAYIVNDGSTSQSYRLILTADNTGLSNSISVTSDLTGGPDLNFDTATFDRPETLVSAAASDAHISLGATATYTGATNKIYTFTVDGDSTQTVGEDIITVNWTDGTNSGSILVTQADTEIDLVGEGADGLRLSISAGDLTAGDTFQVQTFAPILQEASNAEIAFGSTGGAGSPITVVSEDNKFRDVISGVVLDIKAETEPGQFVTVTTDVDVGAIKESIQGFLDAFNGVSEFIDDQNKYDKDTGEAGVLLGDGIVQTVQYRLRRVLGSIVNTENDNYRHLTSIGIRTSFDGSLSIKDSARFEEAIREDLDEVIALFTDSGFASTSGIEMVSASTDTREGENYSVDITQAATQGSWTGVDITDPGTTPLVLDQTNNRLRLIVNGRTSDEIILTANSYATVDALVNEIQLRIDSDRKIGSAGLVVSWEETESGFGQLVLTSSTYGETSTVSIDTDQGNNAASTLGLASGAAIDGQNVAGTINGEEAVGIGQYLTGAGDNDTTAGLKLLITLTADQVASGEEGTITISKGVASRLNETATSLTASGDGILDRRIESYEAQIQNLTDRIEEFDARLAQRRERLLIEYQRMESILAELSAQGDYLSSQISSLNANWSQIRDNG